MNKKLTPVILTLLFLSLLSCDVDRLDGDWDDIIKLSEREVNVTAEANTVLITTEGTWWWIDFVSLNKDRSYELSGIDTSEENFLIEEDEFSIERRNANEILISINKNETGSERRLFIGLQAGDYFDNITIVQAEN